jgi:hypothetical protein
MTPNKAVERTGAMRFSFMCDRSCNIPSFGGRALPAPVAQLGP